MRSQMERSTYRRERFVLTTKKLAVTIHKRNLPTFDTVMDTKPNTASYTTTPNVLAAARRDIEIARGRGKTLEEVFMHDPLPTSHLSDGDFTTATPDKIKLVAQFEAYLIDDVGVGIEQRSYIVFDDTRYNHWRPISRWVENNYAA